VTEKIIDFESESVDVVFLVTVYHEIHNHEVVLHEFNRILKTEGRLIIVEVVEKSLFPGAPVQNPDTLVKEIERQKLFKLNQTLPIKKRRIFFAKNT
jgi:ubiquinone/menaquinone biosynthesis C-methylase UbiE